MQLGEVDAGDAGGAVAGDAAEGDAAADVGAGPGRRRVGQRLGEVQDDARVRGHGRRRGGGAGAGEGEEEQEGEEEKSRPPHVGFAVKGAQMRRIVQRRILISCLGREDVFLASPAARCFCSLSLSLLFLSLQVFSPVAICVCRNFLSPGWISFHFVHLLRLSAAWRVRPRECGLSRDVVGWATHVPFHEHVHVLQDTLFFFARGENISNKL